jgi:hypothetical protein
VTIQLSEVIALTAMLIQKSMEITILEAELARFLEDASSDTESGTSPADQGRVLN